MEDGIALWKGVLANLALAESSSSLPPPSASPPTTSALLTPLDSPPSIPSVPTPVPHYSPIISTPVPHYSPAPQYSPVPPPLPSKPKVNLVNGSPMLYHSPAPLSEDLTEPQLSLLRTPVLSHSPLFSHSPSLSLQTPSTDSQRNDNGTNNETDQTLATNRNSFTDLTAPTVNTVCCIQQLMHHLIRDVGIHFTWSTYFQSHLCCTTNQVPIRSRRIRRFSVVNYLIIMLLSISNNQSKWIEIYLPAHTFNCRVGWLGTQSPRSIFV